MTFEAPLQLKLFYDSMYLVQCFLLRHGSKEGVFIFCWQCSGSYQALSSSPREGQLPVLPHPLTGSVPWALAVSCLLMLWETFWALKGWGCSLASCSSCLKPSEERPEC